MVLGGALLAKPAAAQLVDTYFPSGLIGYTDTPGVTVTSRERTEFEPQGIRLGSVVVRPNFGSGPGYSSNPTGQSPAKGSAAIVSGGSVLANTDWVHDNASAFISADDTRYLSQSSQSFTNWSASLGKYFEWGDDRLTLAASHLGLNQVPTALNTPNLTKPAPYRVDNVRASYDMLRGAFLVTPAVQYTAFRYDPVQTAAGAQSQESRNRDVAEGSVTVKYGYADLRNILVVLRGASINYVNATPGVPGKNANAVSLLAGLDYAAGATLRYRALLGYQVRSFNSSAYKNNSQPIAEANVTFTPNGLTTFTATLTRSIEDAASDDTSSYTLTAGRLTVDHELRRNVLLGAHVELDEAQYAQGGGHETFLGAGASATWLMNRNLRLTGTYDYLNRRTTSDTTITDNVVLLKMNLGL
jgi:hypothetical protein